jgi:hypothetical protein
MIIKPKRPETDFASTAFVHSVPLHAATELLWRVVEHSVLLASIQFVILRWHRRVSPFRLAPVVVTIPIRRPLSRVEAHLAVAVGS